MRWFLSIQTLASLRKDRTSTIDILFKSLSNVLLLSLFHTFVLNFVENTMRFIANAKKYYYYLMRTCNTMVCIIQVPRDRELRKGCPSNQAGSQRNLLDLDSFGHQSHKKCASVVVHCSTPMSKFRTLFKSTQNLPQLERQLSSVAFPHLLD